jgi:hypothetical protein
VTRGSGAVGTPQAVADHIVGAVAPGDVIALHDGIRHCCIERSPRLAASTSPLKLGRP